MKPNRVPSIIQWVFLCMGLAGLIAVALWAMHTRSFVAKASHAPGTVVEMVQRDSTDSDQRHSTTWAPRVQFVTADGRAHEFVSSASSNPPSYSTGEKVDVLFDPARVEDATINGFFSLWGGALIAGVLAGGFFLIGAVMLLVRRRLTRRMAQLRSTGRSVQARVEPVERNTSVSVNGQHPFRVVCQWQDPATSLVHVFHSENLWFDPTPYIKQETVTVYVDPRDLGSYYVDVSFLPRLA
jgi:hypothetical protein